MRNSFPALLLLLVLLPISEASSQTTADPQLVTAIARIKAVDNHAHVPLDAIGPIPLPVRLNPGNLEFVEAWRDLYGYKHDDMSEAHVRELLQTKQRTAAEQGYGFPVWVLDRLVI